MKKVLVLGSNFAGATAALEIKKKLNNDVDVTIVSPSKKFLYVPSLTWIPFGVRKIENSPLENLPVTQNENIHFINEGSKRIFTEKNQIETENGKVIDYDYLIIATGITTNCDILPKINRKDGLVQCIFTPDESIIKVIVLILGYNKLKTVEQ